MKISRRALIGSALALPLAARAQQFAGTYDPQAQSIGEGIWLVRGADEGLAFENGGFIANSVILDSDEGSILIDPGPSLKFGEAITERAERVTGKPVSYVFVTHLHPDHSFGASAFPPKELHALPGTRAGLDREGIGFSDSMYRLLAGWMAGTELILPQGDLAGGPLEIGGRKLQLLALSGHSDADLAILDEKSGTLIAGDLVFHDRAPATPHAEFAAWHAALATLAALPHRQLVPGHGPLDTQGVAIRQTDDWLTWLEDSLRTAVVSGLDMTEAGEVPIPARFASVKAARYELQRSVSHFYPRYEAEMLPLIGS